MKAHFSRQSCYRKPLLFVCGKALMAHFYSAPSPHITRTNRFWPGLNVIKPISFSIHLSLKSILLINIKIPTIVIAVIQLNRAEHEIYCASKY